MVVELRDAQFDRMSRVLCFSKPLLAYVPLIQIQNQAQTLFPFLREILGQRRGKGNPEILLPDERKKQRKKRK
jgi:hypothetical protein